MSLIQAFTAVSEQVDDKFRLSRRLYVNGLIVGDSDMLHTATDEIEAECLAFGFAVREIIKDDERLNTDRKAIVYSANELLVKYLRFYPTLPQHKHIARLTERINLLTRQHRIVIGEGDYADLRPHNWEFWQKIGWKI